MSLENPPLEIVTVPCLSDNYAYLIKGPDGVCLIDAPEAEPIIESLDARGWDLEAILITHHHFDHVAGVEALRSKYGCKIMGPKAEEDKLPPLDMALKEGMNGGTGASYCEPLHVPGHTLGHLAFHFPKAHALFTADSLMALGCGRLFEGSPEMMWDSLSKLAQLPAETMVYSGHEYTSSNAAFALTIEPENTALVRRANAIGMQRAQNQPTAQVPLALELATNPFLRANQVSVKRALGMESASDLEVFTKIRALKDRF